MTVHYPPQFEELAPSQASIFLAGSIEMGKAQDWQADFAQAFAEVEGQLFNPRRLDWDASWGEGRPELEEQIRWELQHMEKAQGLFFHFEPGTLSPVSMLELGLAARSKKAVWVHCPKGFWRRDNLRITAQHYGLPFFEDWEEALADVGLWLAEQ